MDATIAAAAGERVAQHYERIADRFNAEGRDDRMFREFAEKARTGRQNAFICRVARMMARKAS